MRTALILAVSILLAAGLGSAFAQEDLPPGPGMETTKKVCGNCHSVGSFRYIHRTPQAWDTTINNMIGWGMNISDADYDTVFEYLTTYLGITPPPAAAPSAGR